MLYKPISCATVYIAVGTESCCWYVLYRCAVVSNITLCSQAQDSQQPIRISRCIRHSTNLSCSQAWQTDRSLKLNTSQTRSLKDILSLPRSLKHFLSVTRSLRLNPSEARSLKSNRRGIGHWDRFLIRAWNRRWSPSQWLGPLISTWILEHFCCVQGRDPHTWVHHTHLRPQKPTRSKCLSPYILDFDLGLVRIVTQAAQAQNTVRLR